MQLQKETQTIEQVILIPSWKKILGQVCTSYPLLIKVNLFTSNFTTKHPHYHPVVDILQTIFQQWISFQPITCARMIFFSIIGQIKIFHSLIFFSKSCTSAKNSFPMRRTVPTARDIHRLPLCETSPHWHNAFFKLSATQATLPNDHKCDGTITKAGDLIHQISIEQKHTCNFSPHKRLIPSFLFL